MLNFLDKLTHTVVPLRPLLNSLRIIRFRPTPGRVWNLIKVFTSMYISRWTGRQIIWGLPPILMIEPTNICNLKCPMCPSGNGEMLRNRGRLGLPEFRQLLDQVGPYISQVQLWNQGEPFINSAFLDFVSYAGSKGVMTQTSTNGHYIRSAEEAEAIIRSGLDQIIFSLDGTNAETYAKYRVGGNFETVIRALEMLSDAKQHLHSKRPLIELQFIVFKHNQSEIDELIAIGRKNKVDRIAFKSAQVYSEEQAAGFLPDDEEFRRYTFEGHRLILKSEIPNWCKRLWLNGAVNWDGTVSPCCFDKDADHILGDLATSGYPEIWKAKKYQNFRRAVMKNRAAIPMCSNCTEGMAQPYARIVELSALPGRLSQ